jgi:hypothetical protein
MRAAKFALGIPVGDALQRIQMICDLAPAIRMKRDAGQPFGPGIRLAWKRAKKQPRAAIQVI